MFYLVDDTAPRPPWNKGKLIGQKKPLKLKEIWTIRVRLQMAGDVRGLAMFNLAIDSKLRACDLVKLRVTDVTHGSVVMRRATVMQQKTHQRVQFEITEDTREAVSNWIEKARLRATDYLFSSRVRGSPHISTGSKPVAVDLPPERQLSQERTLRRWERIGSGRPGTVARPTLREATIASSCDRVRHSRLTACGRPRVLLGAILRSRLHKNYPAKACLRSLNKE
jgi:integrase